MEEQSCVEGREVVVLRNGESREFSTGELTAEGARRMDMATWSMGQFLMHRGAGLPTVAWSDLVDILRIMDGTQVAGLMYGLMDDSIDLDLCEIPAKELCRFVPAFQSLLGYLQVQGGMCLVPAPKDSEWYRTGLAVYGEDGMQACTDAWEYFHRADCILASKEGVCDGCRKECRFGVGSSRQQRRASERAAKKHGDVRRPS